MKPRSKPVRTEAARGQLMQSIGSSITRFQDGSNAFDDVAADILAVERGDLPCVAMLLFNGPASADELAAALRLRR